MNINLYKNYHLKSDQYCLTLYKIKETKKGSYESIVGYYTNIEEALKALCRNEINASKCKTLTGLSREIKRLEKMIWALCSKLDVERMVSRVLEEEREEEKKESKPKNKTKQVEKEGNP